MRRARGDSQLGQYVAALLASESGRSTERYRTLIVDDPTLERGLREGSLVEDLRLCHALGAHVESRAPMRPAGFKPDADGISGGATVREADIVRLRRHLDDLTVRVRRLEKRERGARER